MEELVPAMMDVAPRDTVEIHYPSGVSVHVGKELTPTQVKDDPDLITWKADEGAFYCLIMTDFDPPGLVLEDPTKNEVIHYMVGNIPNNNISKGDVLFEYIGAGARQGTGLHRYVWLLYKQPGTIDFKQEQATSKRQRRGRLGFSSRAFVLEKNLGNPVAGNFFTAQYDDYVPSLHASFID